MCVNMKIKMFKEVKIKMKIKMIIKLKINGNCKMSGMVSLECKNLFGISGQNGEKWEYDGASIYICLNLFLL